MSTSTETSQLEAGRAVVLVSGGLDSATCLAIAKSQGFACFALSFNYGQRANSELQAAAKLARVLEVAEHRVIDLDMGALGGSALTDPSMTLPQQESEGIPITYVPARNTVFLSYALAWAEVLQAKTIFIGVNALDYSGYPDCRPEFIDAFQKLANLATKAGVEAKSEKDQLQLETPLIDFSKAEIIKTGERLGLDYSLTISCYQANESGEACGRCDSCRFRRKGFTDAGISDPTRYVR